MLRIRNRISTVLYHAVPFFPESPHDLLIVAGVFKHNYTIYLYCSGHIPSSLNHARKSRFSIFFCFRICERGTPFHSMASHHFAPAMGVKSHLGGGFPESLRPTTLDCPGQEQPAPRPKSTSHRTGACGHGASEGDHAHAQGGTLVKRLG